MPAVHRGLLSPPRLTLESRYPLGLFRTWGYWRPQTQVLVWPALDPLAPPLQHGAGEQADALNPRPHAAANEMPEGLRDYRRGDPMRMIAWKKSSHALASGSGLISREAASGRSPDLWLDWALSPGLSGLGDEARLSRLASWVMEADRQSQSTGAAYGLKLPGKVVECNTGSHHLRTCLDTLALWGLDPDQALGGRR